MRSVRNQVLEPAFARQMPLGLPRRTARAAGFSFGRQRSRAMSPGGFGQARFGNECGVHLSVNGSGVPLTLNF